MLVLISRLTPAARPNPARTQRSASFRPIKDAYDSIAGQPAGDAPDGRRKDLLRVLRRHRPGRRGLAPFRLGLRLRQRPQPGQAATLRSIERSQSPLPPRRREPHGGGRRPHSGPPGPGDGVVSVRRSEPGRPLPRPRRPRILDLLRLRRRAPGVGRPAAAAGAAGKRAGVPDLARRPRFHDRRRNAGRTRLPARRSGARRPPLHAAEPTPGVRGRRGGSDCRRRTAGAGSRPRPPLHAREGRSLHCACRPAGSTSTCPTRRNGVCAWRT